MQASTRNRVPLARFYNLKSTNRSVNKTHHLEDKREISPSRIMAMTSLVLLPFIIYTQHVEIDLVTNQVLLHRYVYSETAQDRSPIPHVQGGLAYFYAPPRLFLQFVSRNDFNVASFATGTAKTHWLEEDASQLSGSDVAQARWCRRGLGVVAWPSPCSW